MRSLRVCVTACGCAGGPGVIRALKRAGCRVIGTDMNPQASGRYFADAFEVTPAGSAPDFIDRLLETCKIHRVDVLLPESSAEILAIARERSAFEQAGVIPLCAGPWGVEIAINKARCYAALKESVIPIPPYRVVQTWPDMVDAINLFGYPKERVVIKPLDGKGGRGIRIIAPDLDRMTLDLRQWPHVLFVSYDEVWRVLWRKSPFERSYMVMPFLESDPNRPDTIELYYQAGRNRALIGFTKIRRQCKMGLHFEHEAQYDHDLWVYGVEIVRKLGLTGFIDIQFMGGYLLEVNPRISTMIYQSGFNMPALAVQLATGKISPDDAQKACLDNGTRTVYYIDIRTN